MYIQPVWPRAPIKAIRPYSFRLTATVVSSSAIENTFKLAIRVGVWGEPTAKLRDCQAAYYLDRTNSGR